MARTRGHGNPDWTRDETILALDLYLSLAGSMPDETDPRVVALSARLRGLGIHPAEKRAPSFRNADGVAFKLQNLRQVALGKGLPNVSKTDREVWAAFGAKKDEVGALSRKIIEAAAEEEASERETPLDGGEAEPDVEFIEGRLMTALHFRRERKAKVRKALIAARLKAGPLSCDGCGYAAGSVDERIAHAAFEAHHLEPLSMKGPGSTRARDMALLCATCHRLVHRWIALNGAWLAKDGIKGVVSPADQKAP